MVYRSETLIQIIKRIAPTGPNELYLTFVFIFFLFYWGIHFKNKHLYFGINSQAAGIHDLPGLPAGVKFDPTDQEILEHLEAKVRSDIHKLHPLIDEFIPTLEGENGICCTHPEKLPGQLNISHL